MKNVVKFEDLVARYGAIEAMRTLEILEEVAFSQERKERLLQKPEERMAEAVARLVNTDFAA